MLTRTSLQARYDFRRDRQLVNLAAAAWVATVMISAYYAFTALTTAS